MSTRSKLQRLALAAAFATSGRARGCQPCVGARLFRKPPRWVGEHDPSDCVSPARHRHDPSHRARAVRKHDPSNRERHALDVPSRSRAWPDPQCRLDSSSRGSDRSRPPRRRPGRRGRHHHISSAASVELVIVHRIVRRPRGHTNVLQCRQHDPRSSDQPLRLGQLTKTAKGSNAPSPFRNRPASDRSWLPRQASCRHVRLPRSADSLAEDQRFWVGPSSRHFAPQNRGETRPCAGTGSSANYSITSSARASPRFADQTAAIASGTIQQAHVAVAYTMSNGHAKAAVAAITRRSQIAPDATAAIAVMHLTWRTTSPARIAATAAAASANQITPWTNRPARAPAVASLARATRRAVEPPTATHATVTRPIRRCMARRRLAKAAIGIRIKANPDAIMCAGKAIGSRCSTSSSSYGSRIAPSPRAIAIKPVGMTREQPMISRIAVAGRTRRRRAIEIVCSKLAAAKSVMAMGSGPVVVASMLAALCGASVAVAETTNLAPTDIEGRWVAERSKLVLDIARCATGWCGVEVTGGTACGRTVLRIEAQEQKADAVRFSGRLERADGAQPYTVAASLFRKDAAVRLSILGNTGDQFELWRRTFPLSELLVRTGDWECRPAVS
jgi:hypothetical protein